MVIITADAFDPWLILQQHQSDKLPAGQYGATSVFVGTMRDFNEGDAVSGMTLEHYPGMTEKYLEQIRQTADQRWDIIDSIIVHRTGELMPDQPIVLVAVWSAHRKDAFEASRFIMEELKSKAPFWKKEQLGDASRWVEKNTAG